MTLASELDLAAPAITPYQSTFFAHRITLEGAGDDALALSLSTARVDMNPHQVDAALFAIRSPLSKGVILADEVGLGKTIEASLVIAQRWAERRRRVLLIVPASLRKQWSLELLDKFSLPTLILDAKTYRDLQKSGTSRPFEARDRIVIASYEFAARQADAIKRIDWDLVIFDEAHRLRNVYRPGTAKRAQVLRDALRNPFKVMLTATPLQNSLMELFGLVSFIDDHFFPSEAAFKDAYVRQSASPAALNHLKKRIAPICKRTLRRQVQQAGLIRYTQRCPVTLEFEPSQDEMKLYGGVSDYLQRADTIAFGDRPNALIRLVVRKILGSSTFAVAHTLDKFIARLRARQKVLPESLADIDSLDELIEEGAGGSGDPAAREPAEPAAAAPAGDDLGTVDPKALQWEIEGLEYYRNLARSIGDNAKGIALIRSLPNILAEIEAKGGQRKAVIFTESVRTQAYLAEMLGARGYKGEIALLNGGNNDANSRAIYEDWHARHAGSDRISGSRTADMKTAIVEEFRDRRAILIATESGAEGINLQFCSMVVNYDLPWNPQRVEQRIGRCHRYGQKVDVTVVNFINRKNAAERRVYELLSEKFRLFEGVFGASDEILGAIESGVDLERRILEIVETTRTEEEINAAFDRLQDDLQADINVTVLDARRRLMEEFDERVVDRLKTRRGEIITTLGEFDRGLLAVAGAELPDARFHPDNPRRFDYDGRTWTTEWPLADRENWQFFRLAEGNLAERLVRQAKGRRYDRPAHLAFDIARYTGGRMTDVERLRGRSGWLAVEKLTLKAKRVEREHLLIGALADDGAPVDPETAERLLRVPAAVVPGEAAPPTSALAAALGGQRATLREGAERENEGWLETEEGKLQGYAEDLEREYTEQVKLLEADIREEKKALRGAALPMAEKVAAKRRIAEKERRRLELRSRMFERQDEVRGEIEGMLDEIAGSLAIEPVSEQLFTIRWEVR